jgi:alanine racemase
MPRPTAARINLDALAHNLGVIRERIGPGRKVCAAVKADAYGHGAPVACHALQRAGADMFAVAMTEEALDLRFSGITRPIILLGAVPGEDIPRILDKDVTACITEEAFARELSVRALNRGMTAHAHINIDTGMHRVGLDWETAVESVRRIAELRGVQIDGIFTHFACSDADDLSFSHEQIRRFRHVLGRLRRSGLEIPFVHMANSNGVLRLPEAYFDGVRPGLILYGLCSRPELGRQAGLQPVLSMTTRVCHVKRVREGERVGYGHTYVAYRDTAIATIPIGYHDGFIRAFSNTGEVLIGGRRARVIGRVCMDQTLVDVTDIPEVAVNDEVVVYGRQGEEYLSVEEMAQRVDCIPYELTCRVGRRVRREYVVNDSVVVESPFRSVVPDAVLPRIFTGGRRVKLHTA